LMNQEALTIGFARRFATYKRANLILRDTERLKRLLLDPWRPVQIVFAGKPHPADEPGKLLLREVYEACASPQFGGRIAFIDNYDKQVAHHLVAGVDVWLNNPEPPKEASGTSGQKAALNGALNFSVLDGWWCEGYNGKNGWAIEGHDEDSTARSIYELLENEIVPCFYSRDTAGIPRQWLERMKESIRSIAPNFSTRRMLREYLSEMYFPTS
ncbi:MAG TPA: alpha-glucan family phosphorylase, partial [Acidobacteriota bacterium]|nr:alpha-glucan family phosphorylase [Acidobacteriota bacterium]